MSGVVPRLLSIGSQVTRSFLGVRAAPLQQSTAGFKVKSRLKLRCRSCFFTRVDGRLHVECNEHPRHKQREIFNVKTLWYRYLMSGVVPRLLSIGSQVTRSFLGVRAAPLQQSTAGFKVKSRLKLRCRSCFFTRVDGRLHVECNEHPRHKQREIFNVKTLW